MGRGILKTCPREEAAGVERIDAGSCVYEVTVDYNLCGLGDSMLVSALQSVVDTSFPCRNSS